MSGLSAVNSPIKPPGEPARRVDVPLDRAAEMLTDGIAAWRKNLAQFSQASNPRQWAMMAAAAVGSTMLATAFFTKLNKALRITMGAGAVLPAAYVGAAWWVEKDRMKDTREVLALLDNADKDAALRAEMVDYLSKHMPTNHTAPGERIGYNGCVLENSIIKFGISTGRLSPDNQIESLEVLLTNKGDPHHLLPLVQANRLGLGPMGR